ncbi:hypothetical protein T492DRAFT_845667 [Pavlovales sp. CCMP2436]|nr:hypothetical protein T492DRAFT_845667 [Pavlovales sp. CCMP2436]
MAGARDAVASSWAAHHAGLEGLRVLTRPPPARGQRHARPPPATLTTSRPCAPGLQDKLDATDRLVHQSVRRKNEQLSRLQEELRGLRSRAIERETRARATLERALLEVSGGEGARESVRRADHDELTRALGDRDEALRQLRAQLRDQEQRAADARAESRERAKALDDRERQLELMRVRAREAEAERLATMAASAAVAAARSDESRERALEAELAQPVCLLPSSAC